MNPAKAATVILGCALLGACMVGPDYQRPSATVPPGFKESQGWKPAAPREAASGTAWWKVYEDPTLDQLEEQVSVSNQTLKASEAAWRQAVALADQARAGLLPAAGLSASLARSKGAADAAGGATAAGMGSAGILSKLAAALNASWDLDVWGKIRRTVESDAASAQASEADLAAARLSAQAALATDYMEVRVIDEQKRLLDETIEAYRRSLKITQNQYQVGVAAKSDVITAETQLEGVQSQRIGLDVQRRQLEHAVAVLIGQVPADFAITPATLGNAIPVTPAGVPSTLLERRPDIAEAERKVAAANAQIGVAVAAYYPDVTVSAAYGYVGSGISGLSKAPNAVWSLGASTSETLLDFGARSAQVRQARAAYDVVVANYRQTVLAAFQQVEDQLAALRVLEEQDQVQNRTVESANEAVRLTLNEYKAGTVAFTAVVTAQATALTDAQALLSIRQSRLVASVALIEALGGGWSSSAL